MIFNDCKITLLILMFTIITNHNADDLKMSDTLVFVNGNVYKNGIFIKKPKSEQIKIIDLQDKYIIPDMAEAHHHSVLCNALTPVLPKSSIYVSVLS